jgi:hypothetical protein
MAGMSNDHKVDVITNLLLQSIETNYHNILKQYNMSIDKMNMEQLELRLSWLNKEIDNPGNSEQQKQLVQAEKQEVLDKIKWLKCGEE